MTCPELPPSPLRLDTPDQRTHKSCAHSCTMLASRGGKVNSCAIFQPAIRTKTVEVIARLDRERDPCTLGPGSPLLLQIEESYAGHHAV